MIKVSWHVEVDPRVPLSVAQWHAHVNLCFPPEGSQCRLSHQALNGLTPLQTTGNTAEIVANESEMAHKRAHNTEIEIS